MKPRKIFDIGQEVEIKGFFGNTLKSGKITGVKIFEKANMQKYYEIDGKGFYSTNILRPISLKRESKKVIGGIIKYE